MRKMRSQSASTSVYIIRVAAGSGAKTAVHAVVFFEIIKAQ